MANRLNVVVIGGSETAKQLILDFTSRSFVQVVGVADVDPLGTTAHLAERFGLPFTTDIHDFASLDPAPDVVIDVCGRPHVNPALEETFAAPEDGGPAIVHDTVARLLISVAADAHDLVPSCAIKSQSE